MKKLTLRQELENLFDEYSEDRGTTFIDKVWNLFEPNLKKQKSSPVIFIDEHLVKTFNEFWPKEKLNTGKHGRCSMSELMSSFAWFFKVHPTFTNWEIIMEAADTYTRERLQDNWNYTRRSKYFIRKQLEDKSFTSDLSEYYERILNGVVEEEVEKQKGFEPKVY